MIEELNHFIEVTKDLDYRPKAMFPSELFLFYYLAKQARTDHVIESGVGNGGSTQYLKRLFPGVRRTGIDRTEVDAHGCELFRGQAEDLLPWVVRRSRGKSLAILIDGPKGKPALKLKKILFRDHRVSLVAIHDLAFEVKKPQVLSHDEEFRKRFGFLDEKVGSALEKHPNGPGLSVFIND